MASQPIGFAQLLAGGVLLTMGISGRSVREVFAGRGAEIKPLATSSGAVPGAGAGGGAEGTSLGVAYTGAAGKRTQAQRIKLLHRLISMFPGLSVSEGPGFGGAAPGVHTPTSYHYKGLAYDINADSASRGELWVLRRVFNLVQKLFPGEIAELFYDPVGYYIDNGQKVSGAIGGHGDHLHISFNPAAG